ncbi:MAG: hypothetical protein ACTSUY_01265 [Alphaproteobacteria bacterium]
MVILQSNSDRPMHVRSLWKIGLIAGFAGGIAEVVWIGLYMGLTGGEAALVARGITGVFSTVTASAGWVVWVGIAIHMGLAVGLGVVIAYVLRAAKPLHMRPMFEPFVVVGFLIAVWAMNFFVVLPIISPEFVSLVPYSASLVSKVLFGTSAALVLLFWSAPRIRTI